MEIKPFSGRTKHSTASWRARITSRSREGRRSQCFRRILPNGVRVVFNIPFRVVKARLLRARPQSRENEKWYHRVKAPP
jgi:hypothetical protein